MQESSIITSSKKVASKRLDYIDILNIVSSFAVIVMHCSGNVFIYNECISWFIALFLQSIAHFAIPVFFMITGSTLLEYRNKYDTKTFYKKRILKTGIPFLFWSVFYIFFKFGTNLPSFGECIHMLLTNGVLNIFWFFYEIFSVYLVMPILSLLAKKENLKQIEFFCVLFFFFRAVFPLIKIYIPMTSYFVPSITAGCIGYLFCGYIIKHETFSKKMRITIYSIGALALGLLFFGTYFLSKQKGEIDKTFMDYYSLATMPYSFAVMLFAKHIPWNKFYNIIPQKFVIKLASTSFGVYLLHMIFLILKDRFHIFGESFPASLRILILPIIVYILCVLIVFIFQKIPLLKKLIP